MKKGRRRISLVQDLSGIFLGIQPILREDDWLLLDNIIVKHHRINCLSPQQFLICGRDFKTSHIFLYC